MDGDVVHNGSPVSEGLARTEDDGGPKNWYTRDGRLRGSEQPVEGKCGAKLPRTDPPRYCTQAANNCRFHKTGGQSQKGMSHPNYKHGRDTSFGKYLPKDLLKDYHAARQDKELISLNEQLALLESRQLETVKRLEKSPPIPWGKLAEVVKELSEAQASGDREVLALAVGKLNQLTDQGVAAAASQRSCWNELRSMFQEKARLTQVESKRLDELRQKMESEQVILLIHHLLEIVKVRAETHLGKDNARPLLVDIMDRAAQLVSVK